VEKVCRTERIKNIVQFLQSDENQLFKGRLQLINDEDGVLITVKGPILGKIGKKSF
jgi:hypothetical protein